LSCMYDGNSLLTKMRDTLDQDTTLAFDGNDRITSITDANSREWKYSYDSSGHLTSVRTPTYDQNSNGIADQDDFLSGRTTTYKYDGSGQLTEILRPTDSSTGTWKWTYDGSGSITTETRDANDMTTRATTRSPWSIARATRPSTSGTTVTRGT